VIAPTRERKVPVLPVGEVAETGLAITAVALGILVVIALKLGKAVGEAAEEVEVVVVAVVAAEEEGGDMAVAIKKQHYCLSTVDVSYISIIAETVSIKD